MLTFSRLNKIISGRKNTIHHLCKRLCTTLYLPHIKDEGNAFKMKDAENPLKCNKDAENALSCNKDAENVLSFNNDVENVLQETSEDLSSVTSYFPKSFNLAAYVNSSEMLQALLNLNVNLSKIEKKPYVAEKILKLDLERDIKHHIMFLKDYIEAEDLGDFITKNPLILCERLEDLDVRINYLHSKRFSIQEIRRIILKNAFWLTYSTVKIDERLGYFQKSFDLSGKEMRYLSCKQPKLITYNLRNIKINSFVIKEEMGFEGKEIKQLLLSKPKLWMMNQLSLLRRFNYLHNVIKFSHATLLANPEVLMCRNFRVKQRHTFLEKLGRAQYDPKKENFVPIIALVEGTDVDFCKKYAKCNIDDFNTFLKTL